jgi:DeoR/GlpR family transcriptional regulator of sugar metabolism
VNTERREIIKNHIIKYGEVKVSELQELFPDLSAMTIRRDLAYLEDKGLIIRTRGGARAIPFASSLREDLYSLREVKNIEAKENIAKKAVKFVEAGRSLYFDSGTTIMSLARILPDENLSILTSGPNIGLEIIKKNNPSVTLIGGLISRNNLSTSGMHCLNFIKAINIDIAFMATSGFSLESGFTSGNLNECQIKEAVIKKARKTIMLMDSSKIDKNLPFTFATLKDINVLICENTLPEKIYKAAEKKGVLLY